MEWLQDLGYDIGMNDLGKMRDKITEGDSKN